MVMYEIVCAGLETMLLVVVGAGYWITVFPGRLVENPGRGKTRILGLLIWNDLSNVSGYLRVTSDSGHATSVAIERLLRRLITLIYAGRDRMVVIRRELPRTKRAGPA